MNFGKDKEKAAADSNEKAKEGLAALGTTEGFARSTGQDENNPITDVELASVEKGTELQSAKPGENQAISEVMIQAHVDTALGEDAEGEAIYTSHPIGRLKIGRFRFENGILTLSKSEDVEEFENLLAASNARTQSQVKKIDVSAGNRIADDFLAQRSKRVQGVDTSEARPGEGEASE